MARVKTKTEVATIKLTLECRRAWEAAAAKERRSLANMFEVALLEYCQHHSIAPVLAGDWLSASATSAVKADAAR